MKRNLDQLANVISTQGQWTWWAAKFPVAIQFEFNQTSLYFGDRTPLAPSTKIALAFYKPISVVFISKGLVAPHWELKLGSDIIEHFDMTTGGCGFNNHSLFAKMISEITHQEIAYGCEFNTQILRNAPLKFGFWAGNVGVLLAAESMRLFNLEGEFPLDQIGRYAKAWEQYQAIHNQNNYNNTQKKQLSKATLTH